MFSSLAFPKGDFNREGEKKETSVEKKLLKMWKGEGQTASYIF